MGERERERERECFNACNRMLSCAQLRNRKGRNRGAKKMEEERGAEQMGQGLKIMKTEKGIN